MENNIFKALKINESIFDGQSNIPTTVNGILDYFSNIDNNQNNIPFHIKELVEKRDLFETEEELIRESRKLWLINIIGDQLRREEENYNMKLDCLYKILCICMDLENYPLYRSFTTVHDVCMIKVSEVLNNEYIDKSHKTYIKCQEFLNFVSG